MADRARILLRPIQVLGDFDVPLEGRVVRQTASTVYVEHDTRERRWGKWTIPLDRKTGLPPAGERYAYRAEPAELERAARGAKGGPAT